MMMMMMRVRLTLMISLMMITIIAIIAMVMTTMKRILVRMVNLRISWEPYTSIHAKRKSAVQRGKWG